MAILGLTHDEQGRVKQSLAIVTKVAIGLGPDEQEGRNYPKKLDHFIFLRKEQIGTDNKAKIEWVEDEELTQHYKKKCGGGKCREFWITLIDDDLENVFPNEYAWWKTGGKVCWGDGRTATRRTKANLEGESWPPKERDLPGCGRSCPDFIAGSCKPSADLYFWLADFPALGRACRIHTGGHRSIQQIYSALDQIQRITGGRLTGIKVKLVVRPEKSSFRDARDGGKRKSTTIWALSLELEKENVQAMIAQMTETALVFDRTRKLLGGHTVEYQVVEEEKERAPEIAAEFPPENGDVVEAEAEVVEEISPEEAKQINDLKRLGKRLGYNQAQIDMRLGQHKGDYPKLITELEELLRAGGATTECGEAAETSQETNSPRETTRKSGTPPRSNQPSSQSTKGKSRSFGF